MDAKRDSGNNEGDRIKYVGSLEETKTDGLNRREKK